jgi:hypothetical protein
MTYKNGLKDYLEKKGRFKSGFLKIRKSYFPNFSSFIVKGISLEIFVLLHNLTYPDMINNPFILRIFYLECILGMRMDYFD